jgi:hypothetical protein
MTFTTVFTAFNPAEAQLVRSRLEAAEFHPFAIRSPPAASASKCRKPKPPTRRNFSPRPLLNEF